MIRFSNFIANYLYKMLSEKCYTCLDNQRNAQININTKDSDKITYKEKLIICLSTGSLEEYDNMKMCVPCVRRLRLVYKFLEMLKESQNSIRNLLNLNYDTEKKPDHEKDNEEDTNNGYGEYIQDVLLVKIDTDSEENCKSGNIQKATKKVRNKPANVQRECPHCNFLYSNQCELTKHLKRTHTQEKNFICSYCNKGFKQAYHLQEHITKHTGEKKYMCPICGKAFMRSSSRLRHIKSHNAAPGQKSKRTPFLCTICGKDFPFSNSLQRHTRVHLGIKNYECHICKRKFNQSTHLSVHMRTHTGEKPYVCEVCGNAFSLNCSLQKHMNTHKSEEVKLMN